MWLSRKHTSVQLLLPLAALLALPACDDDDATNPPVPVEWEAVLAGVGEFEDVAGTVLVSALPTRFTAEIEIEDATPNDDYNWTVALGTCAAPGNAFGVADRYPELEIAANGTAAEAALVNVALDEEEEYIVRVTDVDGQNTVTVACGALEVQ